MKKEFRYIGKLILQQKYRYLIGILFLVGVDFLYLVVPKLVGIITDGIKNNTFSRNDLKYYALIIIAVALAGAVLRFLWRYFVVGAARRIETEFRSKFYRHIQNMGADFFSKTKTGDLMAHATNDMNNIRMALSMGIVLTIDSFAIPFVAAFMMFKIAGIELLAITFLPLLILAVMVFFMAKRLKVRSERVQETYSDLTERVRENVAGIRIVKAYTSEKKEIEKFRELNEKNKQTNMSYVRVMSMLFPLVASVSAISFVAFMWYGGWMVVNNKLSIGSFMAYNGYVGMLIWPIASIGWVLNILQRGMVSLKRLNIILDRDESESERDLENIEIKNSSLSFKNVSFKYDEKDQYILNDISFDVKEGETLAIVGGIGSGKSTLANMILKILEPQDGQIVTSDRNLKDISSKSLRKIIGYVPQDAFLFSKTVSENIDFYSGKDKESIEEAAKLTGVYSSIVDFQDKFETIVGEHGVTLSGGQRQRLTIARAILNDKQILVLDDCLSAVDSQTEKLILENLRPVINKKTTVIISHRISTISYADRIIVLKDGKIAESGTHEELISDEGIYFEMYSKQLLKSQLEEDENAG